VSNVAIMRSRTIRQMILHALWIHCQAGLDIGYTLAQLAGGLETATDVDANEVRAELRSLQADRLVERRQIAGNPTWVITDDGVDFCRANYPWDLVDRFTGRRNMLGGEAGQ